MTEFEFKAKWQLYSQEIFTICYGYTHDKSTAEDILQDVFVKYLKKSKSFSDEKHEKYWLIRVAINACKNYVQSTYHTRVSLNQEIIDAYPNPALRKEVEVLRMVIQRLPKKYQEVIILHYYNSYKLIDIAQILSISLTAVKKRIERARQMIHDEMEEYL